jgi:hypothetical protein
MMMKSIVSSYSKAARKALPKIFITLINRRRRSKKPFHELSFFIKR